MDMDKGTAIKTAARWWVEQMAGQASEEHLTVLQNALQERIAARLEQSVAVSIGLGRVPGDVLYDAAQQAGIRIKDFPAGTDMAVATCDGSRHFVAVYTGWGQCRKLIGPWGDSCSRGEETESGNRNG